MQAVHVFNSGVLSGPEILVVPALKKVDWLAEVWSLREARRGESRVLEEFCHRHGIQVHSFEIESRLDFNTINQMRERLRMLPEGTILHSHDAKASIYSWLCMQGLDKRRCRSVVTHHGALARPDLLARFYERIFVLGARLRAHQVLTVCSADFESLLRRGVSRQKLVLHRNGISLPSLEWSDRRASQPHSEMQFAIIGRLSAEKNHIRLLRVLAASRALSSLPWRLCIVGEGPLEPSLRSAVVDLELEQNVRFTGFQSEAWMDLDKYDCVFNFSVGEGIPISILEAGWRTTPVFASAVGGIPELCGPNGAELFDLRKSDIEIAQQLLDFSSDQRKMRSRAENLNHRVKTNFSEQIWLTDLRAIYDHVGGLPM